MSHTNPYAKFVKDPSQVPDPNKITLQQFQKYNSLELEKSNLQLKTLKRSARYIGGVLGLCLVAAWWGEKNARNELFGSDSRIRFIIRQGRKILGSRNSQRLGALRLQQIVPKNVPSC
jgi:hypothetical protein